uniref:Nef protein n=1 Tax=Human immunodeficiency virus type 1 TaxID=11676 RepID=H6CZK4_HV1|nr:nef protein [Human immunodeficiency virus 1]
MGGKLSKRMSGWFTVREE